MVVLINMDVKYQHWTHKTFRYWLPLALMLGLMFYLSSDRFSVDHTQGVVADILNWLFSAIPENTLSLINHVLRRLAHFLEYALLAMLLFRAFRADNAVRWCASWTMYSGIAVIAWAVLDELHQAFSLVRNGSLQDVLLNVAGGLLMLLLITLRHHTRATGT